MKQLVKLTICLFLILLTAELSTAQKPELVVQTGHSESVHSVAFSPDGKTLASGSDDTTIKLWDVSTGRELRTLKGHSSYVISVAFSPDGKTLASGCWDHTIKLWDVSTGTELRTLKGHSGPVNSVAFSPDGKTLASGCDDTAIKLWDVSTGTELRTLKGHSEAVNSVAFSPDRKTLVSGSWDHTVKLWDVATGTELRTLKWHSDSVNSVNSVAFSPDGKTLASGCYDHTIKLWDVSTGTELRTLEGHSDLVNSVNSVAFSADGKTLASGDNTVKLWDVSTGAALRTLEGHSEWVNSVAFSPDAKTLASGSRDHTVKLWDVSTGAELRTLKGHSEAPNSVAFSPDGKTLVSGSWGHTVKLWDVSTDKELRTVKGRSEAPNSVAFSPDGKTRASGSRDTVKLWDVSTGAELRTLKRHSAPVSSVAFSPDGKTLASGSYDHTVKLWDISTGTELRTLEGHSDVVSAVAFSPDGKTLASGSDDSTIRLWDVSTGKELRALKGHSNWVLSVAFSPDGKTLASGGGDNTVKLWDVSSGTELRTLKGHSNKVKSVAFSPSNKYLVSGSWDTTIKIWELTSRKELASLIAFDERDWMVVTPDGLFDGSPAAWNKIIWRFNNNTFDYAPVEAFFNEFYYPGLLTDIFAGKRPKAPSDISQKDRRQPPLKLTLADAHANATPVAVRIDVAELAADKDHKAGSGAQDLRLFRNGSLVKVWRGDVLKGQSTVTLETAIPIVAGENRLTAYAFNHDNIKSSDATLLINGAETLKRQGTAYILAVGVNSYSNPQYNLKYAVPDAEDFAAEIKRQQETLKNYARVEVIPLYDKDATKANILRKLTELAEKAQPEDAMIVYFSGHGTAQKQRFYLIPYDLGYQGPRTELSAAGLQTILQHSISDRELEAAFEKIDAGQLLMVIDACNSGQALDSEEKRRGPMNSKGLAQLAYEKGMYILTAAQSYQAAWEASKLEHGYLTYALIEEGLKQGAADREPKDGVIVLREWLNYATEQVPKMQGAEMLAALRGRGLGLAFVEGEEKIEPEKRSVQTPRVFYRRELEPVPLIIARPQTIPSKN